MMRIPAAAAAITLLLAGPALAQRSGVYAVQGTGADGSRYEGTAQLMATGVETWRVTWRVAGETTQGVGLMQNGTLVIGYLSGRQLGVAIYTPEPDGSLVGRWTQGTEGGVGTERMLPR